MTMRWLPYPLLAAALLAMWLLLNGLSVGQFVLGSVVAVLASWAVAPLQPEKPRLRRWSLVPRLMAAFLDDVLRSNVEVAALILRGRRAGTRSGFVTIPLELRDRTALAVLACIITATPGTAWVEYRPARDRLTIHVLDLHDEQAWIDRIKQRYERLLLEIFE
jgi:multicomponent K+:H+ antiporter subunit E